MDTSKLQQGRFLLSIGLFYAFIHELSLTLSQMEEEAGEAVYLS